jgi:hypothetical protein
LLHQHAIGGIGENPETKRAKKQPLYQGRPGAPNKAPPDSEDAEEGDQAIACDPDRKPPNISMTP